MNRDFGGVLKYRLDWIFVKPAYGPSTKPGGKAPGGKAKASFFEPEMAHTMNNLNDAVPDKLSDPAPITVDLPLAVARK